MSIVTKTGDQGKTSLYSGERVSKWHTRIEAVGTLDELSAHLAGLSCEDIQSTLLSLGAALADTHFKDSETFLQKDLDELEQKLYTLEAALPPLHNFILPGGCPKAIQSHQARAICRRAERSLVRLSEENPLPKNALPYVNRLSDHLFTLARHFNQEAGVEEIVWNPKNVLQ